MSQQPPLPPPPHKPQHGQMSLSFLPTCRFGERLRKLRANQQNDSPPWIGWSLRKLSLISGVPELVLYGIESENLPPSWDVACRLADTLKVKLEAFR